MKDRICRACALLASCALALALAGCMAHTQAASGDAAPAQATSSSLPAQSSADVAAGAITVSARGEVKVVPDKASMGVSVDTEASDAETAQADNARIVNDVIARLGVLGVDEKSIQTSWTNLSPTWDYSGAEERITGYSMSTRLTVSDLDIDDVGRLMQECVAAGATGVDGPQFFSSTYDEAYQEALIAAIEATRPKAEAIAEASGVVLGPVVGVTEGFQDYSVYYGAASDAGMALTEDAAMDIEPGEVSVEASVTVSYAIS